MLLTRSRNDQRLAGVKLGW